MASVENPFVRLNVVGTVLGDVVTVMVPLGLNCSVTLALMVTSLLEDHGIRLPTFVNEPAQDGGVPDRTSWDTW
jgi:hypothetical protein